MNDVEKMALIYEEVNHNYDTGLLLGEVAEMLRQLIIHENFKTYPPYLQTLAKKTLEQYKSSFKRNDYE